MKRVSGLIQSIRRGLTEPIGDLNRTQRALRFAIDLVRHCARELGRDQAPQMAAALTYRTIFSLIPIAVMMLLVFRAFGGFEQVGTDLRRQMYGYLGLTSIVLPSTADDEQAATPDDSSEDLVATLLTQGSPITLPPTPDAPDPPDAPDTPGTTGISETPGDQESSVDAPEDAAAQQAEVDEELRASIDKIISDLTDKVANVNFGSIGTVGLAVLIWAGLSLVITVEQSFNKIYNSPTGRSWHLRIPLYWAVITLGPVLLFVSLYLTGAVVGWVASFAGKGLVTSLVQTFSGFTALAASWLLLFLVYTLMPNTRVRVRSALVGSLVAALLWELSKWGFKLYVSKAVSYSTLYGSLGLIPLFLLWLYITWLTVLFGLELTYTLQTMRGRELEKQAKLHVLQQQLSPEWMIPIIVNIAEAFTRGQTVTLDVLAEQLSLTLACVDQVLDKLQEKGFINKTQPQQQHDGGYCLARPPEDIWMKDLLALGLGDDSDLADGLQPQTSSIVMARLHQAQYDAVSDMTLATVLDRSSPP